MNEIESMNFIKINLGIFLATILFMFVAKYFSRKR
jgi:hypothetical protein